MFNSFASPRQEIHKKAVIYDNFMPKKEKKKKTRFRRRENLEWQEELYYTIE